MASLPTILARTINGLFWWGGNESRSDAKDLDAAKNRIGSPLVKGKHGGGGALVFDGLEIQDGATDDEVTSARRVELVGIGGSFNGKTAECGIWLWNGRSQGDLRDSDYPKVIEMFPDLFDIKVPVRFSGGVIGDLKGNVTPQRVTRFYTDGGRYAINWQDDTGQPTGIVYDTKGTTDESQWTPYGQVRIDRF